MDRLIPDPEGDGAAHADVVIEAIFENVDAKHALLKALDARDEVPMPCSPPIPPA
jgi:3-hydroxyacyl-CoA dehydrogenase/enoyl-CoA hydratase/3-hydroxybutyryl-CoA epimerase